MYKVHFFCVTVQCEYHQNRPVCHRHWFYCPLSLIAWKEERSLATWILQIYKPDSMAAPETDSVFVFSLLVTASVLELCSWTQLSQSLWNTLIDFKSKKSYRDRRTRVFCLVLGGWTVHRREERQGQFTRQGFLSPHSTRHPLNRLLCFETVDVQIWKSRIHARLFVARPVPVVDHFWEELLVQTNT